MSRAVAFTAPCVAELLEVDDQRASSGRVAGRTLVSLVSPGTELSTYMAKSQEHQAAPQLPGYAAIFRIEERGDDVRDVKVGQIVYCMGGHRSWQCQPSDMVIPLSLGLEPAIAVFARMAGVSMTTLSTTRARPPGPVLVLGLGLIGNLAAQVFRAAGYSVFAHDPVGSRVELARGMGITKAEDQLDSSRLPTFSLVVECSGHPDAVVRACALVREGGEVVLVGSHSEPRSSSLPHELLRLIYTRYVHLRSGWEWELPLQDEPRPQFAHGPWRVGSVLSNHALALRWLTEGRLRVEGLASEVGPEEAQPAYQELLRHQGPPTRLFRWEPDPRV